MKRKGTKVYILTRDCTVIGVWSNLKNLIDNLSIENKSTFYMRIYRYIKKHDEVIEIAPFEFTDINELVSQIKIEIIK